MDDLSNLPEIELLRRLVEELKGVDELRKQRIADLERHIANLERRDAIGEKLIASLQSEISLLGEVEGRNDKLLASLKDASTLISDQQARLDQAAVIMSRFNEFLNELACVGIDVNQGFEILASRPKKDEPS